MVYSKKIGKFKLEYRLDLFIIPAPKIYYLKIKQDEDLSYKNTKNIIEVKRGSSEGLTRKSYENMLYGKPMIINKK